MILHQIVQIYPPAMNLPRVSSYVEDGLFTASGKDRVFALECFHLMFEYSTTHGFPLEESLERFCVNIRGSVDRMALDGPDTHLALVECLEYLVTHHYLLNPNVYEMVFNIFETIEKIYSKTKEVDIAMKYYEMMIKVDGFLHDNSLEKVKDIEEALKLKVKNSLIRSLSSHMEEVRRRVFRHFEEHKELYTIPSQRLLNMFD